MGAVVGRPVAGEVHSPDVIFDIKETVHRTPYVTNSVLPQLSKVDHDNEHDLLTLSSNTVIRLQTRQKDSHQGINLYKKELKSVPRELFNHPKAQDVTWLNLACNSLVYNNNGIYVDVDKVAGTHNDTDSSDSEMSAVEEEDRPASKASKKSRTSSAGSKTSKQEEAAPAPVVEGAEVVDEGAEGDDEGEEDEQALGDAAADVAVEDTEDTVEAAPAESTEGEPGAHDVSLVVEINVQPEAPPAEAPQVVADVASSDDDSEIEAPAGIQAPDCGSESDSEAPEAVVPEAPALEGEAPALEAIETPHAASGTEAKEPLTSGGGPVIEYEAVEDVTEADLQQSEQSGEKVLALESDEPAPATPKEEAKEDEAVQDGTVIEDYSKSACDLKSVADTVDDDKEVDKEIEHLEDDIHNIAEKPESPVGAGDAPVESVEGAESPYDAVKEYERQRQQDFLDVEEAKRIRQQELEEAAKPTPTPTVPEDFLEEKVPWFGPVLASDDEEAEDHNEEGEVIKRLPNTLPNRFDKMMNLEELYLGYYGKGNPLRCIPSTVFTLHSLVKLDASSCRLTTLPEAVGNLASLEELWLSGNYLKDLPKTLGNLPNLRSLWVNYNQLDGVPASLSNCTNLEGLYAHGNQIMFLSTALCALTKLKYLGLGRNKLKFLPKNIGEMTGLKEAWLNDNELREVPDSMFEIKGLKTLWLSANQLTSLDERIGNLRKLKVLSLSKNQLTTLPMTLANCSNLRVLALDENKLVALPRSLNQLGYLEELWLNGNAVKEIPEGLYMISNMRKPV